MSEFIVGTGSNDVRDVSQAAATNTGRLEEQLTEFGSKATEAIGRSDRLPGAQKGVGVAQSAADALDSSASYLESHDTGGILGDLLSIVKRHPTQVLLIAGGVGFLIARVLRRR